MKYSEKKALKEGIIKIFGRFNVLDNGASIGGLRNDILSFIDFLREESAMDLEEAIRRYVDIPDNQGLPELREELSECARHFAEWQRKLDADLGNPSYERGFHDGREFERKLK